MEKHYDFIGAADAVGELIDRMSDKQLDHIARPDHRGLPGALAVSKDGGKSWRLVRKVGGEDVEVQFIGHGVLSVAELPPFSSLPRNRPHVLQQGVQLTGLDGGDGSFTSGLQTIREAHLVLGRAAGGQGTIEEWLPAKYDKYKSSPAIDIGNRLFDTKDSTEQNVPLGTDVDPQGIIAAMARKSNMRHTVDNSVLYLDKQMTGNKAKYTPILPQTIRVGDIVEVKFSIIAVPARFVRAHGVPSGTPSSSGHRIKLKLRAIVRIDTEFSDNEARADWNYKLSNKRALSEPEEDGRAAVMRRNGYEDDE